MTTEERARFDALLERVLDALPPPLHALIDEAPVIVEDEPSAALLAELGIDDGPESLCGLHTGTALTERSVLDHIDLPEVIHLFRLGIIAEAGGWSVGENAVAEEIRITLLHEIGHHFGLDEDDLEALGYG